MSDHAAGGTFKMGSGLLEFRPNSAVYKGATQILLVGMMLQLSSAAFLVRVSLSRQSLNYTHAEFDMVVLHSVVDVDASRLECQGCEVLDLVKQSEEMVGVVNTRRYRGTTRLTENYATVFLGARAGSTLSTLRLVALLHTLNVFLSDDFGNLY